MKLLQNKKTREIACPVYDFDQMAIFLLKVINNKVLSGSIGMYHNEKELHKEWTETDE